MNTTTLRRLFNGLVRTTLTAGLFAAGIVAVSATEASAQPFARPAPVYVAPAAGQAPAYVPAARPVVMNRGRFGHARFRPGHRHAPRPVVVVMQAPPPVVAPAPVPPPVVEAPSDEHGRLVLATTPLAHGQQVSIRWGASYYPGRVLATSSDGTVRIHYDGWSDLSDESVTRDRLRLPR